MQALLTLPIGFGLAALASESGHTVSLSCSTNEIGKYERLDFSLRVSADYTNPFDPEEIDLNVRLTTPAGQMLRLPAFWCQEYERRRLGSGENSRDWVYPSGTPAWKARFAPAELGTYEAVAVLRDREGASVSKRLRFECVRSPSRGFLRISPRDPRFLEFSEGQAFFPIGQNLAFVGSQQYVTLSKAEEIFDKLSRNGANYLRVWACCEDWALAIEGRKSAFGHSWDWRPPIVPVPDAASLGRNCLKLSADQSVLKIEPSHPVALRPGTRYLLSGKARLEPGGTLKIEIAGKVAGVPITAAKQIDWRRFTTEFETGAEEFWLPPLDLKLEGQGSAWIDALSLREAAGGPELLWEAELNRPNRGYYNPLDCFLLDELIAAAERKGLVLQLCLLPRDLYMGALKSPDSKDYEHAMQDAGRLLRYSIARWGYSTSVGAWEYWNEMDPALPTERFYAVLGQFLERSDPYRHLRTTSTWGPSEKDCRQPQLDIADVHFYLRPSDKERLADEVEAVLDRTRWLREQAPAKPAHLGEFGLANEKWQPREEVKQSPELSDLHNALWASALSGASGTAMFWWWERLDQREFYPHYRALSKFIAEVPWTSGEVKTIALSCSEPRVRVIGLQSHDRAWLWLFNREAAWARIVLDKQVPATITKAQVEVKDWPGESCKVRWWDTRQGTVIRQEERATTAGLLLLEAPDFSTDIGCQVGP